MGDWLEWSAHPKLSSFIAFNDLQPSRYAMSFIEEPNHRAYKVQLAFIALDAENFGELANDYYHTDFGDNTKETQILQSKDINIRRQVALLKIPLATMMTIQAATKKK
jgi:hypothetical protein